MKRKLSVAEKVRRLIDQGYTNKAIVEKLAIKPQVVYNIRYQVNKARGLGAIGKTTPPPADGIGMPPKRKYVRKDKGTGIIVSNDYFVPGSEPLKPTKPYEPMAQEEPKELRITMIEPPTLWQRIKQFFKGD